MISTITARATATATATTYGRPGFVPLIRGYNTVSTCANTRRRVVSPAPNGNGIGNGSRARYSTESNSNQSQNRTPTRPCPKCQRSIPLPLSPCPNCSTLLPLPNDLSLHSLLYISTPTTTTSTSTGSEKIDIPLELSSLKANGYELDKADLRSKWVRRQRELHPDKFASRGEKKVSLARELSGRVNEAYNTLGDELKRAEYILSVHQQGPQETDKITDPLLLAEIMEAREELEEAETAEDIQRVRDTNHLKVKETISALHEAFSHNPPDLQSAKDLAVQLRYWRGLESAAREKVV